MLTFVLSVVVAICYLFFNSGSIIVLFAVHQQEIIYFINSEDLYEHNLCVGTFTDAILQQLIIRQSSDTTLCFTWKRMRSAATIREICVLLGNG
jgi:hypothetical protein